MPNELKNPNTINTAKRLSSAQYDLFEMQYEPAQKTNSEKDSSRKPNSKNRSLLEAVKTSSLWTLASAIIAACNLDSNDKDNVQIVYVRENLKFVRYAEDTNNTPNDTSDDTIYDVPLVASAGANAIQIPVQTNNTTTAAGTVIYKFKLENESDRTISLEHITIKSNNGGVTDATVQGLFEMVLHRDLKNVYELKVKAGQTLTQSQYQLTIEAKSDLNNNANTITARFDLNVNTTVNNGIVVPPSANSIVNGDENPNTNLGDGRTGENLINGHHEDDTITGSGNDVIAGGLGNDTINLDTGSNSSKQTIVYLYDSSYGPRNLFRATDGGDVINNFKRGEDTLILADLDETPITNFFDFLEKFNVIDINITISNRQVETLTFKFHIPGVKTPDGTETDTSLIINFDTSSRYFLRDGGLYDANNNLALAGWDALNDIFGTNSLQFMAADRLPFNVLGANQAPILNYTGPNDLEVTKGGDSRETSAADRGNIKINDNDPTDSVSQSGINNVYYAKARGDSEAGGTALTGGTPNFYVGDIDLNTRNGSQTIEIGTLRSVDMVGKYGTFKLIRAGVDGTQTKAGELVGWFYILNEDDPDTKALGENDIGYDYLGIVAYDHEEARSNTIYIKVTVKGSVNATGASGSNDGAGGASGASGITDALFDPSTDDVIAGDLGNDTITLGIDSLNIIDDDDLPSGLTIL